jgi:hypothetical protein
MCGPPYSLFPLEPSLVTYCDHKELFCSDNPCRLPVTLNQFNKWKIQNLPKMGNSCWKNIPTFSGFCQKKSRDPLADWASFSLDQMENTRL